MKYIYNLFLQIESPAAYNARGFVTGQMFNRKGEVCNLTSIICLSNYVRLCATMQLNRPATECVHVDL